MKRFVIVGTGGRGTASFVAPLLRDFRGRAEVVGLLDANRKRAEACNRMVGQDLPIFDDFDEMMRVTAPDGVIVTTQDSAHAEYVIGALERNCEAISEKPLCTTPEQIHAIRRAAAGSKAAGYVTHNMRFGADVAAIRQHIQEGAIGDVLHIQFCETLDRFHGADYFRRWHRFMANSAGLLVHKASHHFDLINWFARSLPQTVTAQGGLHFYGAAGAFHGPRCSDCPHSGTCDFHVDMFATDRMRMLYKEVEDVDGYFRDACVFDPRIDIPDTVSSTISYENGITVGYTLLGYAAYESLWVAVEGTRGRLELFERYNTSWAPGHKDTSEQTALVNDGPGGRKALLLYPAGEGPAVDVTPAPEVGGHGGSDPKCREAILGEGDLDDPLGQKAPLEEGIQAVLVGLAANESIRQGGKPVAVQSL